MQKSQYSRILGLPLSVTALPCPQETHNNLTPCNGERCKLTSLRTAGLDMSLDSQ
jgi:hypothetical protein